MYCFNVTKRNLEKTSHQGLPTHHTTVHILYRRQSPERERERERERIHILYRRQAHERERRTHRCEQYVFLVKL